MKVEITAELTDVYGGDGCIRMEQIERQKMKRKKMNKQTKADIGVTVSDSEIDEENVEIKEDQVNTFRVDETGKPILRLGGMHGKIYGGLRESAKVLKAEGVKQFTSGYVAIVNSIMITPVYMQLKTNGVEIHTCETPQILQGLGNRMVLKKYDVIDKCTIDFTLSYPDALDSAVKKMLDRIQCIALFNRRRATMRIIKTNVIGKPDRSDKVIENPLEDDAQTSIDSDLPEIEEEEG